MPIKLHCCWQASIDLALSDDCTFVYRKLAQLCEFYS